MQQRTHQGAQPPLGPVADDGTPHRLPDDEPHSHRPVGRGACDVDDECARARPPTAPNGHAELGGAAQAVRCGEHDAGRRRGVRRRVPRGPCGGALRGWRGPRECASAAGSRASWPGAGCSAGRSACSPVRLSTHDCRGSGSRNAGWRQRAHRAQGTAILAAVKPEHGTSVRVRVKPECRPLAVDNFCGETTPLSSAFRAGGHRASARPHHPRSRSRTALCISRADPLREGSRQPLVPAAPELESGVRTSTVSGRSEEAALTDSRIANGVTAGQEAAPGAGTRPRST